MTQQLSSPLATRPAPTTTPGPVPPERRADWRRLRGPVTVTALIALLIGAIGEALSSVLAGRLAAHPSSDLVWALAVCAVGAALLGNAGRVAWAGVSDRAEGQLRDDLLDAALRQPLAVLSEQAVGEVLDRVDDDTHEVGTLRPAAGLGRRAHRCSPRSRCGSSPASPGGRPRSSSRWSVCPRCW